MLHPEGNFDAEIENHGLDESQGGTPFAWARFKTEKGTITGFFYLTDRSAEYSMEKIDAMGFTGMRIEEFNAEPPRCKGNQCEIVVGHEEYEGKVRAKVQFVNKPGGGMMLAKSEKAAASVSRFNGLLERVRKQAGTKAEKPAGTGAKGSGGSGGSGGHMPDGAPYDADEDIPF